jgi:hypothetical protein
MKLHGGKVIPAMLLMALFAFLGRSGRAHESGKTSDNPTSQSEKALVLEAVHEIEIEIARDYLKRSGKEQLPDSIKSVEDLNTFLRQKYPNGQQPLPVEIRKLDQYAMRYSGHDIPPKDFLSRGVQLNAMDADGKPLYDGNAITSIVKAAIKAATTASPLPLTGGGEGQTDLGGGTVNKEHKPGLISAFAARHGYSLCILVVLSLLCNMVLLLLVMRGRAAAPPPRPPMPPRTSAGAKARVTNGPGPRTNPGSNDKLPRAPHAPKPGTANQDSKPGTANQGSKPETATQGSKPGTTNNDSAPGGGWLVVRASLPGLSHVRANPPVPCQDSNSYQDLGDGWGLAVVCDGAGSKPYSHLGSQYVAKRAGDYFAQIVRNSGWRQAGILPARQEWHDISKTVFREVYRDLETFAPTQGMEAASLACTVIVVVYSPHGLLATHIGDGRAAFLTTQGEWIAAIKPYKGEEANQTVFITSLDWDDPDQYIESTVFQGPPRAFALLSDGCEFHSFEVNVLDADQNRYRDPNRPYPKFFGSLVDQVKSLHGQHVPPAEIDSKWREFLGNGSEGLKNEPDDKTMILGVLVD